LNPKITESFHFETFFRPFDPEKMTFHPVSSAVNDVKNNSAECIEEKKHF